jgi:hypothetical protein
MRKSCKRRVLPARPPRALRPKLAPGQVIDLGVAHWQNVDLVAQGQADEQLLWELVECVYTWSFVADALGRGVDEMRAQLEMVTRMVERFGATGRVTYTGLEYQLAKRGCDVMDALAVMVDKPTAIDAVSWSELQVAALLAKAQAPAAPRPDNVIR